MYARNVGERKLNFAVANDNGYAEILLVQGKIKKAYYGDRPDHQADFMHRKYDVLRKMANISLACFVEMFENLSTKDGCYEDAKMLLKFERNKLKNEIANKQELQEKINKLLE